MKEKVPCPDCSKPFYPWTLPMHQKLHHMPEKLNAANEEIKQLKAELSDVKAAGPRPDPLPAEQAELSDETRLAVLGNWLDGLTEDAWAKIGQDAGWLKNEEAVAEVADAKVDEKPPEAPPTTSDEKPISQVRRVYYPHTGLVFKVLVRKPEAKQ